MVGSEAAVAVQKLAPNQPEPAVGMVRPTEIEIASGRLSALVARLTQDEFAVLTPPGQATAVVELLEAAYRSAEINGREVTVASLYSHPPT